MAIDAFDPRSLQRAIEIRKRPTPWYSTKYFRPAERVQSNRIAERDKRIQTTAMAPIQRPTEQSRMIARDGFSAITLPEIPYMKPGMPTNAEEIIRRRDPGTSLYDDRDLVVIAQRQIGRDIEDLDDMIERRKEYMAAQGVVYGVTPIVNIGEDSVPSVNAEVDWQMPSAHLITLTGGNLWTASTSDPIANLRAWSRLPISAVGLAPNLATLGVDAAAAFLAHAGIQSLLDNRRIEAGTLELRALDITGITYLGRFAGVDFYEDARTYTTDAGSAAYYTPADRLVLGSDASENRWAYGPISDLKCPNPLVQRWVKTWEKDEPSQRLVAVHASPLPCLWQPDANVSAKVV